MTPNDPTAELRCEEAQSLLSRDLDGEVRGADRARLEAHVAACPACARARAELASADGLLRDSLPPDAFGADFAADMAREVSRALDQRTVSPRGTPAPAQTSSPRGLLVAFAGRVGSRGAGIIAASAAAALFFAVATGSLGGAPAPDTTHPQAGPLVVARAFGKGLHVSPGESSEGGKAHLLAKGDVVQADESVLNTSGAGTLFLGEPSRVAAFDPDRGNDPELTRIDLRPDTTLSFHVERDGGTTVSLSGIGGVAYFEVAKQEHPFRVASGNVMATVLGTRFVVEASRESSTVAVIEGRVRVTTATQHVVLSSRQEASFAASQGILVARPSQPRAHLAWNPRVLASLPAEPTNVAAPLPARSPEAPKPSTPPAIDPNADNPVK